MEIGFELERALLWIVLLPLAGAFVNGIFGRGASRATVHTVAVGAVAVSFALGLMGFIKLWLLRAGGDDDPRLVFTLYEWFSITAGNVDVPIYVSFVMDPLSAVMTLVVTGVGLLIHIYACGYMAEDPDYPRFFCYMNLFMASMLVLVLGSSLPLMFIGWEGVGLCSYLLIGFWFENATYAAAGRKAFVTNRIGDFGVLIGMFLLVQATGSFEFSAINHKAASLANLPAFGSQALGVSVATAAALFLFLGCTGKSAQIPLFVWLPDAMAGPTPVSALIHAATMVTSGVYLICRLSPVFAQAPDAMAVVAVIGTLT
ncbi:MAG: proton-conducting transporter membrane subunit, partial [Planctomycetota bacterium]